MNATLTTEELSETHFEQLLREVDRYLIAVETFRAEGAEPVWRDHEALGEQRPLVCRSELAARPVSADRR
jgi:hypothetical protein